MGKFNRICLEFGDEQVLRSIAPKSKRVWHRCATVFAKPVRHAIDSLGKAPIKISLWRQRFDPLLLHAFMIKDRFKRSARPLGVWLGSIDNDDDTADFHGFLLRFAAARGRISPTIAKSRRESTFSLLKVFYFVA